MKSIKISGIARPKKMRGFKKPKGLRKGRKSAVRFGY